MSVRIRLFAAVRDAFGVDALDIDAASVGAALRELTRRCPSAAALLNRSRFAVNRQFVDAEHLLLEGDELAVIPPVSGG